MDESLNSELEFNNIDDEYPISNNVKQLEVITKMGMLENIECNFDDELENSIVGIKVRPYNRANEMQLIPQSEDSQIVKNNGDNLHRVDTVSELDIDVNEELG